MRIFLRQYMHAGIPPGAYLVLEKSIRAMLETLIGQAAVCPKMHKKGVILF
jgi:hypothetical protein